MKTKEKEIDALIQEALSQEEAEYYESLDEQSMPEMFLGLYKGKNAWLNVLVAVVIFVFFGLAVYCTVMFLQAESLEEMIKWGGGGGICFLIVTMLKIWSWMQMDKNALVREMKKLEYQVSLLASKQSQK